MLQHLNYSTDGAEVCETRLLAVREDIVPFDGEKQKQHMRWNNWEAGFSKLEIPGLVYKECQLVASYYKYAVRGNRDNPQLSRSQSVLSHWRVNNPDTAPVPALVPDSTVTAFFPIYDGIGFWIGKRRREENISYYTEAEETAIAQASAVGALAIHEAFGLPQQQGDIVYRCVWAPGKAFDSQGQPLPSIANRTFGALGLTTQELNRPSKSKPDRTFRVYGDIHARISSDSVGPRPFTPALAEALIPAWKHVSDLPYRPDPPHPGSY